MTRDHTGLRILRGGAIAAAVLVALLVGMFGLLFTPAGERVLAKILVMYADTRIAGEVRIGELDFHGDVIELANVEVETPKGDRVLTIGQLTADLDVSTLFGLKLGFDELVASDWILHVRQKEGEWNVARAVAGFEPPEWLEAIHGLRLRDGLVELAFEIRNRSHVVRVQDIHVTGSLEMPGSAVTGGVALVGHVAAPMQAALAVELDAHVQDSTQIAEVVAEIGEAEISASARMPTEGDVQLSEITARLAADVPAFTRAGFTYGPIEATVAVDEGRVHAERLRVELPGTKLVASSPEQEAFVGTLAIEALGRTTRAIEALTGATLPDLDGQGELALRIGNPLRSARVSVEGELARVGVGERRLEFLRIDASAQASVEAEQGLGPVRIEMLQLAYPGAAWALAEPPVHVAWLDGGPVVQDFAVVADGQRIGGALAWNDATKRVHADITDLRLSSLPDAVLPRDVALGGVVDGDLRVVGTGEGVQATANLRLSRGRVEGVRGVSAELTARYDAGRVRGELVADAFSGSWSGRFDVPASFPPEHGARIEASVDAHRIAIGPVWRFADQYVPPSARKKIEHPSGRVSLSASVDGRWPTPQVTAEVQLRDGSVSIENATRYHGIELAATVTRTRIVVENLEVHAEDGTLAAEGTARRVGDRRYRYRLGLDARRFPLPVDDPTTTTLEARLDGVVSPERITSTILLDDVRVQR